MQLTHPSKIHSFTRTIGFLFIAIGTVVNIAAPIQNPDAHPSLNVSNDEFSSSSKNSNSTSIYPRMDAPPNYTDLPPQTKPIEACLIIHSVSPLPADTQESLQAAVEELLRSMIPAITKDIQRGFKQVLPDLNIMDFPKVIKIPVTSVQYKQHTSQEGMYAFDLTMGGKLDILHNGERCNLHGCGRYNVKNGLGSSYYGEISQACVEDGKKLYTGFIGGNNMQTGVMDKLVEFKNGETCSGTVYHLAAGRFYQRSKLNSPVAHKTPHWFFMQLLSCTHIFALGLFAGPLFLESTVARPVNLGSDSIELQLLLSNICASNESSRTTPQPDNIHDCHYRPLDLPKHTMEAQVILHDEIPDVKIECLLETTIETMLKPIIPAIVDSIAQSRPKLGNFLRSSGLITIPVTRLGYVSTPGVSEVRNGSYSFDINFLGQWTPVHDSKHQVLSKLKKYRQWDLVLDRVHKGPTAIATLPYFGRLDREALDHKHKDSMLELRIDQLTGEIGRRVADKQFLMVSWKNGEQMQ
ncbi:hypothetical protein EV368DRAFT_84885 [Lentinula lateritia]|nr:hypothetical protein EV368DRAFT_84885 [Lentinula lateritia]